ncbi:hypothetical protein Aperf_G00000041588 [Anoplocephala perfoliata]
MLRTKSQVDTYVENISSDISSAPEKKALGYKIATLYVGVRDYNTALKYLKSFISDKKDFAPAYQLLGEILEALGDFSEAVEAYGMAYSLIPSKKELAVKIRSVIMQNKLSDEKFQKYIERSNTHNCSAMNEEPWVGSCGPSGDPLSVVGMRIDILRKLLSNEDYDRAFDLCTSTINDFVCIERASWYSVVLDLVSRARSSLRSRTWYNQVDTLKGFALAEILRLSARTACLSDFLSTLAQLDAFIVEALRSSRFHDDHFIVEMQLRLFFYLSVYIQRAAKSRRVSVNVDAAVSACLIRAARLELAGVIAENPFSHLVWEHVYTNGLSLRLQSTVLIGKYGKDKTAWEEILEKSLCQDNLSPSNAFKFEFLRGLAEPTQRSSAQNASEIYRRLLKFRPSDLSTILWYILCSPCREQKIKSDSDLALPSSRLKTITDTAKTILPDAPFTSEKSFEICQMDVIVFLMALSISYLLRYASSPSVKRNFTKAEPLSWPSQPLCLLDIRLIPSGLQRHCWLRLCSYSINTGRFLKQLRFMKSAHAMPFRLALRVAKAISSLPLADSTSINSASAVAARIWESGLKILIHNTEITHFNSLALRFQDQCQYEAALFPNELNSDWWYGTHVENLVNVAAKDRIWFFLGWSWLTSYWLKHPPLPNLGVLIDHVNLLVDTRFPPDTDCLLLASRLTIKAVEQNKSSPLLKPLVYLTLGILDGGLSNAQKIPLSCETTAKTIRDISEAIGSLQGVSGFPFSSVPELAQSITDETIQLTKMTSGYGAYSSGGRSSSFGLLGTPTTRASGLFSEDVTYRSPRIPTSSLANASTAAVIGTPTPPTPDLQTTLLTQMVEQWMPSFMEFSKVMSETSVELTKSRLHNEELSRLLKETRNHLDSVIADQQKQQYADPSPGKQPERSAPSLEDWRALQESLHEVTAALRDFRRWLPSVMPPPPPHPPALFSHPPPPLPPAPGQASVPQPGDMLVLDNQKAQMALNHLIQQQRQLQSSNSVPSYMIPQPPLTTGIGPQVPTMDFRIPPPCLFPTGMTPPQSNAPSSTPPANPIKAVPITPVKPSADSTFSATATTNASPMATTKNTTTPPAVQEFSTSRPEASHSPAVSKSQPLFFQTASTTTTSSATSSGGMERSLPLFSFSNLTKSVNSSSSTPALSFFGNFCNKSPAAPSSSGNSPTAASGKSGEGAPKAAADGEDKPEPTVEKPFDSEEQITNDKVLFRYHAQLFCRDKPKSEATGTWIARGTGELKVLADDETNKHHIFMRGEQDKKVCANHYILPGISIKRHPHKVTACTWNACDSTVMDPDNCDLNGTEKLFMAIFETAKIAGEFEKIVESCLEKSTLKNVEKKDSGDKSGLATKAETQEGKKSDAKTAVEKTLACGTDAFKPKPGSWTCSTCLLVLDPSKAKCPACGTPKSDAAASPDEVKQNPNFGSAFGTASGTAKSQSSLFGFSSTITSTPNLMSSFAFGTGGLANPPQFSFGNPTVPPAAATTKPAEKPIFVFPKFGSSDKKPSEECSNTGGSFSGFNLTLEKSSNKFTFNLTPPSSKSREPVIDDKDKSDGVDHDDTEDGEVTPSDLSQVTFKPLIDHLPEKVEAVTGEEGEDVLFEARAKLFRFDSGDGEAMWKERGLGQLKILKSQTTDRVRLVMRREQVHKVCCNHLITSGMSLKPMEGSKAAVTPWVWWAIDFSDEEAGPEGKKELLSVRFKTAEDSQAFHDTFVKVAETSAGDAPSSETESGGVEIVDNPLPSEKVERARALQLPDDFYAYELKEPGVSARSGHVRSEREKMTPSEEAAEDALLEAAVSRGIPRVPSSSSSFDVIKSTESLVITSPPVSPPLPTNLETPRSSTVSQETPENKSISSTSSGGGLFAGLGGLGSSRAFGDFGALSKDASAQPSWLKPKSSDAAAPWAGAGSTLFSSLKDDSKGDSKGEQEDENEPDPQFEPLIPLPSLVEAKTGEEGEVCLYLRRCKLYRMVDNQWKERGIGDLKILVRPRNKPPSEYLEPRSELPADVTLEGGINYARILMRRDQVLKICANQTISVELPHFKPLTVTNYGLCWAAKDFSEEVEGEIMTLGLKFKTEQDLTQFNAAIVRARKMLKE